MQPKFDALYRGVVTSNVDTSNKGRIKVQCPQIAGLAELRVAEPANPHMPVPSIGSTVWVTFSGGDITKPVYINNSSYIYLANDGITVVAESLTSSLFPDAAYLSLVPGVSGALTGASNAPYIAVKDVVGTSATDLHLSGSVIKTTNTGTPYTWQTPTYTTGWAGNTSFNGTSGVHTLRYRKTAEDETWFYGSFTVTSTSNTAVVFSLPAGYYSGAHSSGFEAKEEQTGGTYIDGFAYVSSAGNFHIDLGGNFTRNVGDKFWVDAKIPIGNIA